MELEGHMSSYDHHHRKVGRPPGPLSMFCLALLSRRADSLLGSRYSSAGPLPGISPAHEGGAGISNLLLPLRLQRLLELKADENQRTKASRDRKDKRQAGKEAARLEAQ